MTEESDVEKRERLAEIAEIADRARALVYEKLSRSENLWKDRWRVTEAMNLFEGADGELAELQGPVRDVGMVLAHYAGKREALKPGSRKDREVCREAEESLEEPLGEALEEAIDLLAMLLFLADPKRETKP